ncbi:MAG: leucine-rich repeat protein, partial [Oscillospiraceae bacterium]|nr:leucine-rich repeat protein [Oscillospiraceae bacterium]
TTVGSKAMAWNDTVTQVVLSGSVTSVAEYAFTGAAFKTLDMTASVTSIGKGATECAGLKTVNYTGTEQTWLEMTIGKYNNPLNNAKINRTTGGVLNENIRWDVADNGVLTITGTGELPVYKAGLAPWYVNCTGVTTIVISDGITGISANAFYGCTNVNEVYLPATLQTVGENAFVSSNSIAAVSYAGTQFQWAAVTVGNGDTGLTSAKFIYNAAVLTAIQVKTLPSKLEYNLGDTVADTTGIVLTLIYNDGSTEEVSELTADYVVTVDASQMGNGMVTITYKNKTATYMVDVIAAGTCGENVTWTLKDGVLTLSGEGEMTYYAAKTEVPWWDMKTEITTLVVEEGITGSISKFAFYDCVNMTSATLPEGITFLGSSAFYNCSSLTEIDIPDSVTGISSTVFGKNTALTTVAFGENMTSIGDGAFRECTGLTTVNYGGSRVTWAAMDISTTENDALLNATINYAIALPVAAKVTQAPDKVQYVPGEVVDTTGMLLSIVYDDGSEQPYDGEFTLSDNTVAAGMTTIYVTAGEFTTSFRIEVMPGGVTEEGIRWYVDNGKLYIDYSGAMPDYSSLNPAPWVQTYEESDYWFSKVEFLGDITYIGSYTFDGCYDVYTLALPESVTAIGDYAFCGMSSLEELAFGVNVTTIGTGVLNYCDCMMNLYYGGNSVTWNRIAMGEDNEEFDLFDFNYGMHEPDGVRVVSMPNKTQYLYWESLDLTGLVLEYYYGDYDITTPYEDGYVVFDGLVDIGENLIYLETIDCYPVTLQVTMLPSGYCGAEGDNLRWSLVDGKLTISGEGEMFYYDTKADVPWWNYKETVTSAEVEAGMTGRLTRFAFYNCVNMESASLPEGVTFLGSSAFFGCSSLKEIVIPNTVTGMSSTVFGENRSLTTVTFGESVEEIGSGAFRDCDSLTTVNYGGSRTTWANISINATDNDALHNAKINYARVDLTSVEITAQPTKLSYLLGEELDTTGLELTAHYDDGSSLVVTDFTAEADMTQVGVVIVTVSYGGKTAQYTIGIGYGGYTEDGLFWQYADGVLTVDYVVDAENPGTGVMQDYTEEIPAPWSDLAAEIQNIIVGEGVSAIGAYAFYNCGEMTAVILPLSLTAIGENAFLACDKLEVVTYVGSDDQWKAVNIAKTGNEKLLEIAPQFTAMLGDINEDGAVDTLDLLALQAHLSGKMKDIFVEAADVNVDGTVDTLDLLALQAYLSGKITNF